MKFMVFLNLRVGFVPAASAGEVEWCCVGDRWPDTADERWSNDSHGRVTAHELTPTQLNSGFENVYSNGSVRSAQTPELELSSCAVNKP